MHESPDELRRLQALLDASAGQASAFLRSSFEIPEHSLSAAQIAAHLQGELTVALATSTARHKPRVAPIGALFVHGSFYLPTVAESGRARHLAERPAASLTYFEGVDLALIAHGDASRITPGDPEFDELDRVQVACGSQSVREWQGSRIYLQLHADRLYTYARHPDRYAEFR